MPDGRLGNNLGDPPALGVEVVDSFPKRSRGADRSKTTTRNVEPATEAQRGSEALHQCRDPAGP